MPKEYLYCSQCQNRLTNNDFHRCFEIRGRLVCDGCVTEAMAPLSLKEQEEILLMIREAKEHPPATFPDAPIRISTGRTSNRLRAVQLPIGARPSGTIPAAYGGRASGTIPAAAGGRVVQPDRTPWGAIMTLVVILITAGLIVLFVFQPKPDPVAVVRKPPPMAVKITPPPATKTTTPPTLPAAVSPAEDALQKARAFVKDHPADLSGQVDEWKKALLLLEGTALAAQGKEEFDALRTRQQAAVAAQLAELDLAVAPHAQKEEFKRALVVLEAARSKHRLVEWTTGIDTRSRDLSATAWKIFQPLRDKALDAKSRAATTELGQVRDRVASWGLDTFVKELDRVLSAPVGTVTTTPPPPPADAGALSAELKTYRTAWEKALAPTVTRHYAAALKELEKAPAEGEAKFEAAGDAKLLKAVATAVDESRKLLAAWPRGSRLPLEVVDADFSFEKSNDPVVRASEEGVELLRGGAAVGVDILDIGARCLGAIWRARPAATDDDRRTAALLCLLEGDTEGARRHLDGPSDLIPAKYWQRSARLVEARSNRKEVDARKLWFAAERENAAGKTRVAAIAKYRALLNDFADSELVRTRRDRIVQRRDAGREYVFLADDLDGAGTLKLSRHAKAGACWISMSDSPAASGPVNFTEFQFYALPDVAYRCWAYVAGCCQENLTFYLQSTDLTVMDPETKTMHQAEPGSGSVAPVKHSIAFLKSKHEAHGGPKEAKRWEWVSIPLPKYTAGGAKVVRLITDQKGFGSAAAVVSASRTGPPTESEMKAWARPEAVVEEPGAPEGPVEKDPSLAGWWKLDDAGGATALDFSGGDSTAILSGGAERGPGKFGQALVLDGKDAHATIPNSAALDRLQEKSYTISAWFKPASRPAGKAPEENAAYYAIVMKTGVHEGLKYGADMKFAMDHWLADSTGAAAVSGTTYPPGTWYHVAGVVNRTEGTVRLYVNGRLEGTNMWAPATAPRDFGTATWKLGVAAPGATSYRWAADGVVDDVRLYARALAANELKALAGGSAAGAAPSVAITSPGPGETYEAGATITLQASIAGIDRVSRVDFLLGGTVVASDTAAPWAASWTKVPSGIYTVVARASLPDRGAPPVFSKPLTVRVGDVQLFRAINLGGPQRAVVDGITYEPGSGAPNLSINGERLEKREVELDPPADAQQGLMLRSSISYRDGTVLTLTKVPNGTYQIYLYVWEDNENTVFDILVEDKTMQARYASGAAGTWAKLGPWTVDVTTGNLKLAVKGGPANFSGLEVWKVAR